MPYVLPLTEAQLKAIRASVPQAKDMPIRPLEKWSSLSSEEARHCFESGDLPWPAIEEEQPPPPPPPPCAVFDPALSQLCDSLSISAAESVRPCIGCRTFEDWLAFAEASSRPELLAELKRLGVEASHEEAAAILKKYDDDGSKALDVDEFAELAESLAAYAPKQFMESVGKLARSASSIAFRRRAS